MMRIDHFQRPAAFFFQFGFVPIHRIPDGMNDLSACIFQNDGFSLIIEGGKTRESQTASVAVQTIGASRGAEEEQTIGQ